MNRQEILDNLRTICLAYPEAIEDGEGVGDPAFKVRQKIFAMQHRSDDRPSIWCKAPPGIQEVLVSSQPEAFFVPPYVGHHGWIGMWLGVGTDWARLEELVDDSYRMTAPKRLVKALDDEQT